MTPDQKKNYDAMESRFASDLRIKLEDAMRQVVGEDGTFYRQEAVTMFLRVLAANGYTIMLIPATEPGGCPIVAPLIPDGQPGARTVKACLNQVPEKKPGTCRSCGKPYAGSPADFGEGVCDECFGKAEDPDPAEGS